MILKIKICSVQGATNKFRGLSLYSHKIVKRSKNCHRIVTKLLQVCQNGPEVATRLSNGPKVSQDCHMFATRLSHVCHKIVTCLSQDSHKIVTKFQMLKKLTELSNGKKATVLISPRFCQS